MNSRGFRKSVHCIKVFLTLSTNKYSKRLCLYLNTCLDLQNHSLRFALYLRWRVTKINDIHDFTGYCYFHDKTELGGCFLHSVLLALSLGPD